MLHFQGKNNNSLSKVGEEIYQWIEDLFPICRSITGPGVRETLQYIKNILPELTIHSVPSGTKVFDWVIPDEWSIKDAYIKNSEGEKVVDFKENNLHVIGYSVPVNKKLTLEKLNKHLHSLPGQPEAIPYITSYYKRTWGFCLKDNTRRNMKSGLYQVYIDSKLKKGVLNYGEIIIPGIEKSEVLISVNICHPSLANNELAGPAVATALARWLLANKSNRYTYRFVFIPETIGSITYISKNLEHLKSRVIAGFVLTCVGDNLTYSFIPSRKDDTLADRVTRHVLRKSVDHYNEYSFLDRGGDERQYCSPMVDLPVVSIMRSKYHCYPEYHTSLDNLDFISPAGLYGSFIIVKRCIACIENNVTLKVNCFCEPNMGKRDLYPTLSTTESRKKVKTMMDLITYCDGSKDLLQIADAIDKPMWDLINIVANLKGKAVLSDIQ